MKYIERYILITVLLILLFANIIYYKDVSTSIVLIIILVIIQIEFLQKVKSDYKTHQEDTMKKLEQKLKQEITLSTETEQKFHSLIEFISAAVIVIDIDGNIVYKNSFFGSYFPTLENPTHIDDLKQYESLYKYINNAFLIEKEYYRQIKIKDKHYDINITPQFNEEMYEGSIILIYDITKLKNAEHYQKQFTADVSHELRTPLSSIKGYTEILLRRDVDKETTKEFLTTISKESIRMEAILSDLMTIAKLERADYDLELNDYNIASIIEEVVSTLLPKIDEKGLVINKVLQNKTLTIDKLRISQVLMNIIKNAVNYTDQGSITVHGVLKHNEYLISISDTGIGINKENQETIFKRFYRVDKARSRDTGGSGLGLSISKNIILKHGGKIWVDSSEEEGATFYISLPIK